MRSLPECVVLDASVVIKLFVSELHSGEAQVLLDRLLKDPDFEIYAPDLLFLECSNVLWKYIRSGRLSQNKAESMYAHIHKMDLDIIPIMEYLPAVLSLSVNYDISVYDACYVQVANLVGGKLVTEDLRLVAKVNRESKHALPLNEAWNLYFPSLKKE